MAWFLLIPAALFLFPAFAVQFAPSLKVLALATLATGVALSVGLYFCVANYHGGDRGFGAAYVMVMFLAAYAGLAAGAVIRAGILVISYALSGPRPESSDNGDTA